LEDDDVVNDLNKTQNTLLKKQAHTKYIDSPFVKELSPAPIPKTHSSDEGSDAPRGSDLNY
jgi:hypothetical protein